MKLANYSPLCFFSSSGDTGNLEISLSSPSSFFVSGGNHPRSSTTTLHVTQIFIGNVEAVHGQNVGDIIIKGDFLGWLATCEVDIFTIRTLRGQSLCISLVCRREYVGSRDDFLWSKSFVDYGIFI